VESFRGYTAERSALENARRRFDAAGIQALGCVTPVNFGKPSSAGSIVACYTDTTTRKKIQEVMEYTASLFDTIMVDDFLFTDCECPACLEACGNRPMPEYRCSLMTAVSREHMILPARKVNPSVKIIIKYPQWYDDFHRRGYEVLGETDLFDIIWVGTETRDSDLSNYERGWEIPQYEGYFIMRWLGGIGKEKTGGGWFDALGTTPVNYLEQARQTVLADAREMMLFSYGGLIRETNTYGKREGTGVADVAALRKELPALFRLAALVKDQPIRGIQACKPANSDPYPVEVQGKEFYHYQGDAFVYDYIGMMGFPLVPTEKIDEEAPASFFPLQALKDPGFKDKLTGMLRNNIPVMVTETLASRMGDIEYADHIIILKTGGNIRNLLEYDRQELLEMRGKMLAPLGIKFDAPAQVSFYLIGDHVMAFENFNREAVDLKLEMEFPGKIDPPFVIPVDSVVQYTAGPQELVVNRLPARTLVLFEY
jgi:hypothetical protein